MKKLILSFALAFVAVFSSSAADLTEVWKSISSNSANITAKVDNAKAAKQGFEELTVSLNPNADAKAVKSVLELTSTISENQKLATSTNNGITVTIYATPADANGESYDVMYVLSGESAGVNQVIVLYGKVTRENMTRAMTNINLEELIGV